MKVSCPNYPVSDPIHYPQYQASLSLRTCSSLQRRRYADIPSPTTVNLNHFRLLRVVGKGAFGKVRIVERKDTGLTFALKYIRKDEGQHRWWETDCWRTDNAYIKDSGPLGERTEYHQGAEDAGTPQSCLPLQLAVQLSGHRVLVSPQPPCSAIVVVRGLTY